MSSIEQHRVTTGCYVNWLCSSRCKPGSSGRARCKRSSERRWRPSPLRSLQKVFTILLKIMILSTPVLLNADLLHDPIFHQTQYPPVSVVLQLPEGVCFSMLSPGSGIVYDERLFGTDFNQVSYNYK